MGDDDRGDALNCEEFMGFPRENGDAGVRNLIGVLSTVSCANDVARWAANGLDDVKVFTHGQGCAQTQPDLDRVERTLISLGKNPNLAGVVVVGLGCESVEADAVGDGIVSTGKPAETFVIQDMGGAKRTGDVIRSRLMRMREALLGIERSSCSISSLKLGIKCGGSDTTSGLAANPALGNAVDRLLDLGGNVVFGETTELIGAEEWMVSRGRDEETSSEIMRVIHRMEERAKRMGVDMRDGQPTGGNIRGGLSTIEEKSLGAAIKTGNRPIDGVVEYGDIILRKGLVMVDTPGREPEFLTGIAASGAQMMAFTTGKGAPHNFPFMPVLKITANPKTANELSSHIDVDVSPLLDGSMDIEEAGKNILSSIVEVASGKTTCAERMGYDHSMNIYTTGPVI
jgi:altronate dehydratase large subunit